MHLLEHSIMQEMLKSKKWRGKDVYVQRKGGRNELLVILTKEKKRERCCSSSRAAAL